jgi:hypothetical protein
MATTAKRKKTCTKSNKTIPVPTGDLVTIKSMGAGAGFYFTSGRKPENTGFYVKTNSPNNKAMNFNTFGIVKFDPSDEGVPANLSLLLKS